MEDINWGAIGILIIFLAMTGHILYELFFKKKFKSYTVNDFRELRISNGEQEYASKEENEEAENILKSVFDSWTVVDTTQDEEFRDLHKSKQVKKSTELLNTVISVCPTDEHIVNRLNELSNAVNLANKREFNGSIKLIIIVPIVFALFSFMSGSWSSVPYFAGSIIFYVLSSFTPLFVINRKRFKGHDGKGSFMSSFIGGLFGTIAAAKTVKYINKDTNEVVDTDNSETWWAMGFTFVILVLISFFVVFIALINYIRNYWLNF